MSLTVLAKIGLGTTYGKRVIDFIRYLADFTVEDVWVRPIKVVGAVPADIRERFIYGPGPAKCEVLIAAAGSASVAPTPSVQRLEISPAEIDGPEKMLAIATRLNNAGWICNPEALLRRTGPGNAYYHSGNLGDLIYGLYAIQADGGGRLLMGDKIRNAKDFPPTTRAQWEMLQPLLAVQPYLASVGWRDYYPAGEIKVDMNVFRDWWLNWPLREWKGIHNLCQMQFYYLGIPHKFEPSDIWLDVPNHIETGRVVIHRSPRYQQSDEMWRELMIEFPDKLLFVGLQEEHAEFERQFGKVSFWKVADFLEMAQLIAGAVCFVGNQSFPMALAIGMGQAVYQETYSRSPDCVFARTNFQSDKGGIKQWIADQLHWAEMMP